MEFARVGFKVVGFDVSERVCAQLNAGQSHIQDVPSAEVAEFVKSGHFHATVDVNALRTADAVSIAVPTPPGKTNDPDMSYVQAAASSVSEIAHPGLLVVFESTTYPGTTREVVLPLLTAAGFTIGEDIFVAFSPERVDPGNPTYNTRNTPKVVGRITTDCTELATALYASCIETIIPVSSTETAELVKLLENTFRSVNIAMANEMAIICDKLGVNVWEVIDAAATKPFGFMKFTAGPGIGGHCIPLDPHYLAWKMRTLNYRTRFIELAGEINSSMPTFVVEKVAYALNLARKPPEWQQAPGARCRVQAQHRRCTREPGPRRHAAPRIAGGVVSYHDPFIATVREDDGHGTSSRTPLRHSVPLTDAALRDADLVVIVTDHSSIDYQQVVDCASIVVDTRNALAGTRPGRAHIVTLSSDPVTDAGTVLDERLAVHAGVS